MYQDVTRQVLYVCPENAVSFLLILCVYCFHNSRFSHCKSAVEFFGPYYLNYFKRFYCNWSKSTIYTYIFHYIDSDFLYLYQTPFIQTHVLSY